jgi:hypothetical protein
MHACGTATRPPAPSLPFQILPAASRTHPSRTLRKPRWRTSSRSPSSRPRSRTNGRRRPRPVRSPVRGPPPPVRSRARIADAVRARRADPAHAPRRRPVVRRARAARGQEPLLRRARRAPGRGGGAARRARGAGGGRGRPGRGRGGGEPGAARARPEGVEEAGPLCGARPERAPVEGDGRADQDRACVSFPCSLHGPPAPARGPRTLACPPCAPADARAQTGRRC